MTERFEYHLEKSRSNASRHGIDFLEAQSLWKATHAIIPAKNVKGEGRWLILGLLEGKCYAAVFTKRRGSIRLISCHRADKKLEKIHEKICGKEKERR